MTKKQELTFKELYRKLRNDGYTSQHIIKEMAKITHSSTATVRNWVYTDRAPQSALVSEVIAAHYNVSAEKLFQ